jgi:ECF sigma factor
MSTAPASHPDIPRVSMSSLAGRMLSSLSSPMREELCRHAASNVLRLRAALETLFLHRCGEQPSVERLRFLFFVAPLVRRLVIGSSNLNGRVGGTEITFADVKSWLEWLDSMDPLCARMIDLRYFAGLSVKETASLLDLPPAAIVRELRFARAWLRIKEPAAL